MCLHKSLLKRSPLCKLGTSNVTNISPRRCTNALRRSGTLLQRSSAPDCGLFRSNYWASPPDFSLLWAAACQSSAVPISTPPSASWLFPDSSPFSRPAARGLRLLRQAPPLPSSGTRRAAPPRPLRRQPSPTSGYWLQPPRLRHYGHGGGDGSAEAEQAGHQGAGIIFAPFLQGDSRCGAVLTCKLAAPERRLGLGGRQAGRGHYCPACSSGAAAP